jgi:hypothetical protein
MNPKRSVSILFIACAISSSIFASKHAGTYPGSQPVSSIVRHDPAPTMAPALDKGGAINERDDRVVGNAVKTEAHRALAPRAAPSDETGAAPQAQPSQKIIKSASISLQVKEVGKSADEIRRLATATGGFVSNSTYSAGDGADAAATVEVRIPAASLERFIASLGNLGTVMARRDGGEDVTEAYIDDASRLRNLQTEEQRLLNLMGHAGRIPDLLTVEKEVTRVRGEIEQIQGHLKHVDYLVAYSSVTVSLTRPQAPPPPPPPPPPAPAEDFWGLHATLSSAWLLLCMGVRLALQSAIYMLVFAVFIVPVAWPLLSRRSTVKTPDPQRGEDS